MGLTDLIAEFINTSLDGENALELRRAELAEMFGCVPSQVNYVISTRFSPESGYIVESRRGGGGYIRIRRVTVGKSELLMHAANGIGFHIDAGSAVAIINNLHGADALTVEQARLIAAAVSEQSLRNVPSTQKPAVRADILKRMLLVCADS